MEEWKKIDGYEYEISNQGRIRKESTLIKIPINRGYPRIGLWKDGKCKCVLVHRLVGNYFIPNINNKPMINHINGIKTDNRACNLEWCTDSENKYHAYKNDLNKGRCRKPLICIETKQQFASTFKAAEWLNDNKFQGTKRIKIVADKIRCSCRGLQKIAYDYHWKYID